MAVQAFFRENWCHAPELDKWPTAYDAIYQAYCMNAVLIIAADIGECWIHPRNYAWREYPDFVTT